MLKGTILTTIGILGTIYCFFILPFGMLKATTLDWVIYGAVTLFFLSLAAIGMNIRTKHIVEQRRTKI